MDMFSMHESATVEHEDGACGQVRAGRCRVPDLLWGDWDASRFQIIELGMQPGHAPDESVMRAAPASSQTKSPAS
jgi:hypothetical protein